MKVTIVGATGFIGRELGIALVRAGHELTALVRNVDKAQLDLPFPCKILPFNVESNDLLCQQLSGQDAVINLAGEGIQEKPWTAKRIEDLYSSRTGPTTAIVQALKKLGPSASPTCLINASAIGFYGDRKSEELDETSKPGVGILPDICREWEAAAETDLPSHVRLSIVRIGVVLGKGGGMLGKVLPIFRNGAGANLGSGKQYLSWIHLQDMVAMIVWLLENPNARGIYNGTAPQPVTNAAFTKALAKTLNQRVLPSAPAVALKAALGTQAILVLGSQNVFPRKAHSEGFKFKFDKLDSALQNICGQDIKKGVSEFIVKQWLPKPVSEIFPFFQNEKNLEILTPPFLNFKVLGKTTENIESGTLIDYQLQLHGLPIRWRTEILDWTPPHKFVDTQIKGPYSLWHHTHTFEELGGGTLMTDCVQYKVPLGVLGKITAGHFVANDVGKIFKYRKVKSRELFGSN